VILGLNSLSELSKVTTQGKYFCIYSTSINSARRKTGSAFLKIYGSPPDILHVINALWAFPTHRTSSNHFSLATSTCTSSQATQTCPILLKNPHPSPPMRPHQLVLNTSQLALSQKSTTSTTTHISIIVEKRRVNPHTTVKRL
jgi:hypothetical protein